MKVLKVENTKHLLWVYTFDTPAKRHGDLRLEEQLFINGGYALTLFNSRNQIVSDKETWILVDEALTEHGQARKRLK